MVFVTVGSQKFPFDRLIQKVDEMVRAHVLADVFIQTGGSRVVPCCPHQAFCQQGQFGELLGACDVLITHGGAGTMVDAVKRGKRTIVVPRLARYGEHVDDHQMELAKQFHDLGLVYVCLDVDQLPQALQEVEGRSFGRFQSQTETFLASLDFYLSGL